MSASSSPSGPGEAPAGHIAHEDRTRFILAISIAVIASSLGDIVLKQGMSQLHLPPLHSLAAAGSATGIALANPVIREGIGLMLVHFAAFVVALRLGPLSVVVPLRSVTYIFTTLMAHFMLGEQVSVVRWIAIMLILMGVSLIGRSAAPPNE